MSHAVLQISKGRMIRAGLLGSAFVFLTACAAFEDRTGPKPITGPVERIYSAKFYDLWRATNKALQSPRSYPLRVNNMDTGLLETETIKGSLAWTPPHLEDPPSAGYSYRLKIRVIKGNVGDKDAYKVSVQKIKQLQRDFFSEAESLPSDGLEERSILYRIEREMQIDRAIKRAVKKQNKQPAT